MFTLKDTWGGSILDADNSRKKGSTSRRFTPSSVISIGGFVYVASYDGNLKIYAPRDHDTFKSDLICNTFINPQIIKLGSGHYM
ncbi:hypothetical protein BC829DRAFT_388953 [Chytridium lagenaria]|nr:hypothetical protein BC829DRAFT_388953 [Chytridium lagenaria]